MRITRTYCPGCKSEDLVFVFKTIDYTVSQEEFEVWQCKICSLRFTQNVPDMEEIAAYYKSEKYISHSDTSRGFINSLYHIVRKKTLLNKKRLIEKHTGITNGKILDVGSGTGAFLDTMKQSGWTVTGFEPDEDARSRAKKLHGLDTSNSNLLFKETKEKYDAITLWHVLEHVHDLHKYVNQLKEILNKDGRLFIAVPNYTCYDERIYKAAWAAYDVPRHLYHFSPDAMITLLMEHGLKLKSIKPMFYDSFYVSMLSEKYKSGKNNFIKAFFTGLVSNYNALKDKEKCSSIIYIIGK